MGSAIVLHIMRAYLQCIAETEVLYALRARRMSHVAPIALRPLPLLDS